MSSLRVLLYVATASATLLTSCYSPREATDTGSSEGQAQARVQVPEQTPGGSPAETGALAEAIALHLRGVAGDDEAAIEALSRLELLAVDQPDDPRVRAYLGSARVLRAKRYFAPWKKGATCKSGLALLDDAVSKLPEDPEIRLVRALSTYPLPAFLGRRAESAGDFAWLFERSAAAVERSELSRPAAAFACLHHGLVLAAAGDRDGADQAWELALSYDPDGVGSQVAQARGTTP